LKQIDREREREREFRNGMLELGSAKKKTEKKYHEDHDEESIDYILLNQKY
jgi:hypothetical protein